MSQGDPFFDRLRALQPDIDIVVLPPVLPTDGPVAEPDTVETLEAATAHVSQDLLDEAGLHAEQTWQRWQRTNGEEFSHRTRRKVTLPDSEAAGAAVVRMGEVLVDWGWHPEPVEAVVPWIVAAGGRLHVDIAAERHHVVLTVTSDAVKLEAPPA